VLAAAVVVTVKVNVGDVVLLTFKYPEVESVQEAPVGQPVGAYI
jgi:hypothetical protein